MLRVHRTVRGLRLASWQQAAPHSHSAQHSAAWCSMRPHLNRAITLSKVRSLGYRLK